MANKTQNRGILVPTRPDGRGKWPLNECLSECLTIIDWCREIKLSDFGHWTLCRCRERAGTGFVCWKTHRKCDKESRSDRHQHSRSFWRQLYQSEETVLGRSHSAWAFASSKFSCFSLCFSLFISFITSAKEVMFSAICLSVCLLAGLRRNYWTKNYRKIRLKGGTQAMEITR